MTSNLDYEAAKILWEEIALHGGNKKWEDLTPQEQWNLAIFAQEVRENSLEVKIKDE